MRVCYVDESGCTGTIPSKSSSIQPVFILSGVVFQQSRLHDLTNDFLAVKTRYFPGLTAGGGHYLDSVLPEIKGADVRRQVCSSSRRKRTHAIGFLDRLIELLEAHQARLIGRVWIKALGIPLNHRSLYTFSVQSICTHFQNLLLSFDHRGVVIADSRSKPQNAAVSHSIFTQKFSSRGDSYSQILEMPTYGHSENHVGLQLADLVCSAFLFPLATSTYCTDHISNVHVQPGYSILKYRYGNRLRSLQYRYRDGYGRIKGGITVSDSLGKRDSSLLFFTPPLAAEPFDEAKAEALRRIRERWKDLPETTPEEVDRWRKEGRR